MLHHRTAFFPALVGLLTISLIVLFLVYSKPSIDPVTLLEQPTTKSNDIKEDIISISAEPVISPIEYESQMTEIMKPFFRDIEAVTPGNRQKLLQETIDKLIAERVPSGYQDVHLFLVRNLQAMQTTDEEIFSNTYKNVLEVRSQTAWLP